MKEYKLVVLNPKLKMRRKSDAEQSNEILNEYIRLGWKLKEIVTPCDGFGTLVGVFYMGED